jgi:hypothetical protein
MEEGMPSGDKEGPRGGESGDGVGRGREGAGDEGEGVERFGVDGLGLDGSVTRSAGGGVKVRERERGGGENGMPETGVKCEGEKGVASGGWVSEGARGGDAASETSMYC